ncbi:Uncharacterised protein [Avibacterium paragallinarum]|uniref:Uncharacterized protein n=2 Tax=Avibacterium paragallinarum TaxID=728 RepID=A0A380Z373_AVIPA|nr:Uncharacterised protein [Avibacterium paragallinarum]
MNIVIERNPVSKKYWKRQKFAQWQGWQISKNVCQIRQKKSKRENLTELRPHL